MKPIAKGICMRNSSKPIRNGPLLQTFDQKRFLHQENFFEPIDLLKVPYTQGFLIQNGVILIQIVSFLLKKFQKVSGSIKTFEVLASAICLHNARVSYSKRAISHTNSLKKC